MAWIKTGLTKSGYGFIVDAPNDGVEKPCLKKEIVESENMPFGSGWVKTESSSESSVENGYVENGYVENGYVENGYVENGYHDTAVEEYVSGGYVDGDYCDKDTERYVDTDYVEGGYIEGGSERYVDSGYVDGDYVDGPVDQYVEGGTGASGSKIYSWTRWIYDPVFATYDTCLPYDDLPDMLVGIEDMFPVEEVTPSVLANPSISRLFGLNIPIEDRISMGTRALNEVV